MADNVVRRDVVQIDFQINDNGISELESRLNSLRGNTDSTYSSMQESANQFTRAIEDTLSAFNSASSGSNDFSSRMEALNNQFQSSATLQNSLSSQLEQTNETLSQYAQNNDLSAEATERLEEYSRNASESISEFETAQREAAEAMALYEETVNSENASLEDVEAAQQLVIETTQRLAEAEQRARTSTDDYTNAVRELGDSTEETEERTTGALESIESLLTGAGILSGLNKLKDAFLECSEAAAEFENALAKVSTIADTSSVSMTQIDQDIMALSMETGDAVSGLAEATYQAISASVDSANAVEFVSKASELATAGFTAQATAADILTTAINAYGMEVSDASEISDMLITTQNLGKTSVDELASSMGKVIPLAAAYNVEMDNLSTGYAQLTKNGIATAEATTYMKSMLNELGSTGSEVSKILFNETGQSFAELTQSGNSLGDVLQIIGDSVNGDTVAFNNLWSSQEAGVGALALFNSGAAAFNNTLVQMQDSAGATAAAYQKMTDTTLDAKEDMENAFANLGITIGSQLNPVMKSLYETVADVTNGLTEFAEEHPAVVAAVTGAALAVGALAAAVTAYTLATKAAEIVTKAFDTTLSKTKIGIIIGTVAAVGAAFGALAAAVSNAEEEVEDYNGTLEQCRNEITETEKKYNDVVDVYGKQSSAAKSLEKELKTLNAQYEKGGGAVADYAKRAEEAAENLKQLKDNYKNQSDAIKDTETSAIIAAAQLETLSNKAVKTNSDLDLMGRYADYLNDTFECNIEVNYATGDLTGFNPDDTLDMIKKQAEENRKNLAAEEFLSGKTQNDYIRNRQDMIGSLIEYRKAEQDYIKAKSELENTSPDARGNYFTDRYNKAKAEFEGQKSNYESLKNTYDQFANKLRSLGNDAGYGDYVDEYIDYLNNIDESGRNSELVLSALTGEFKGYEGELSNVVAAIRSTTDETFDFNDSIEKNAEALSDEEAGINAANRAYQQYQSEINELCEAYDKVYQSALESFQGQFGLFDEASMQSDTYLQSTVENAQKAMQTQLDYWNEYGNNIERLKAVSADDLGITQENYNALMSYVQSGSEEAAGLAASMVKNIDNGNQEALTNLANTIGEVNLKQSEVAQSTADWVTDFSIKMNEIAKKMNETVGRMELSKEARDAATNTINSYTNAIIENGGYAIQAAENIATQVKNALASASGTINLAVNTTSSGEIEGTFAKGTLSAPRGLSLVGEEGPELVWLNGGERVFNNDETNQLLSDLQKSYDDVSVYIPRSAEEAIRYVPEGENITNNYSREFVEYNSEGDSVTNSNITNYYSKKFVEYTPEGDSVSNSNVTNNYNEESVEYTPEGDNISTVNNNTSNVTNNYSPEFVININGSINDSKTNRQVKTWFKRLLNECAAEMESDNMPVVEI